MKLTGREADILRLLNTSTAASAKPPYQQTRIACFLAGGGTPPVCTRDARAPLKVHRITLANFIRDKNLTPWKPNSTPQTSPPAISSQSKPMP